MAPKARLGPLATEFDVAARLGANLRVLCGYPRSVASMCREIGLSRQQFTKYLSGRSTPSLRSMRRICDHFGLEEWELLQEHGQFRKTISLKPKVKIDRISDLHAIIESNIRQYCRSPEVLAQYTGYYHYYFMAKVAGELRISKSLIVVREEAGVFLTKEIERADNDASGRPVTNKYDGIMIHSAGRLFLFERQRGGRMIWHTILYATDVKSIRYLSGLGLGVTSKAINDIACYRVILQFLGKEIDKRSAIANCGQHSIESDQIPEFIRARIHNVVDDKSDAFSPLMM